MIEKIRMKLKAKDSKAPLYLGMLLAVGILLMFIGGWPTLTAGLGGDGKDTPPDNTAAEVFMPSSHESEIYERERELEKRLEEAFSLVEGVGRVRVVVSYEPVKENIYAVDSNTSENRQREVDAQGGTRETSATTSQEKTIMITDSAGVDRPLVLREIEPKIEGVVLIAEGGESVFVKDALTKAACTVLGIEANKVQVLKMRED